MADRQRLVHCYRGQLGGYSFVVGNAYTTISVVQAAAYNGPLPAGEDLEAAFCVLSLPTQPTWIRRSGARCQGAVTAAAIPTSTPGTRF